VEQDIIVCGGFDKKVYFIDTRQANPITTKKWHRQPVLCVAADANYIISGSEDKTFSVYDRRAGRVYKSIQVQTDSVWFGRALKLIFRYFLFTLVC
jgi:F-box/WD-40 domain protein 9